MFYLFPGNVDTNDFTCGSSIMLGDKWIDTKTWSDVKYFFTSLNFSYSMGITYTLIVVSIFSGNLYFLLSIAKCSHDRFCLLDITFEMSSLTYVIVRGCCFLLNNFTLLFLLFFLLALLFFFFSIFFIDIQIISCVCAFRSVDFLNAFLNSFIVLV